MDNLIEAIKEAERLGSDGWYSSDDPPSEETGEKGFWVPFEAWEQVREALKHPSDCERKSDE